MNLESLKIILPIAAICVTIIMGIFARPIAIMWEKFLANKEAVNRTKEKLARFVKGLLEFISFLGTYVAPIVLIIVTYLYHDFNKLYVLKMIIWVSMGIITLLLKMINIERKRTILFFKLSGLLAQTVATTNPEIIAAIKIEYDQLAQDLKKL